jgi:hypothetical protein
MPSIISLITKLQADFPTFTFTSGKEFRWSPQDQTIYYPDSSSDSSALLHELAHAMLQHNSYTRDIQLIEIERDAWDYAKHTLAERYAVTIDETTIQEALDTYRDWLHARSTCPECQATGLQSKTNRYKCLACHTQWRVNEARVCALRRYTLT